MIHARIEITLKDGVLDPQADTIKRTLAQLGLGDVAALRQSKCFEVALDVTDEPSAHKLLKDMCERVLANQVIETYHITIVPQTTSAPEARLSQKTSAPKARLPKTK